MPRLTPKLPKVEVTTAEVEAHAQRLRAKGYSYMRYYPGDPNVRDHVKHSARNAKSLALGRKLFGAG
jgi:hypothetical protein